MRHLFRALVVACPLFALVNFAAAEAPVLKPGDHVAIIGDSITEQKLYSLFMEDYLLMCQPESKLQATQFGWGGETAPGFAGRMANDMLPFKATVATTCYGMNDGGYGPMDEGKAKRYRDGQKSIIKQCKDGGVRVIVVGSPGCVDTTTFRPGTDLPKIYNKTLGELRDIARDVAQEEKVLFANVYDPMYAAMQNAKSKFGTQYHVCGGDGFHPDRNGHLVMAYAFLKALGCDGHIGTITVDLTANKAEATAGHKILSSAGGQIEVESTKYPFCFYGEPKQTSSTRGIVDCFPFNAELNRYLLVVKGVTGKAKVTWGGETKEFSAEDLAKGVNLAAEFMDSNPFRDAFKKVEDKVAQQQAFETGLVKNLLHHLPEYRKFAPEESAAFDRLASNLVKKDVQARAESATAIEPVKHKLTIEVVK